LGLIDRLLSSLSEVSSFSFERRLLPAQGNLSEQMSSPRRAPIIGVSAAKNPAKRLRREAAYNAAGDFRMCLFRAEGAIE
jgi:hypothetical protein